MKSKKIRLGILYGGQSAEHEISLLSARNIIDAVDRNKYDVVLLTIDKRGRWHLNSSQELKISNHHPQFIQLPHDSNLVTLSLGESKILTQSSEEIELDVIFPILHGPLGEDGTVQGLLKLLKVPFVGSGVLGSAVGMDKDVMKRLLQLAGLPVLPWISLHRRDGEVKWNSREILKKLGPVVFVKPANMGSSVGVSKAKNENELDEAIKKAFLFDHKVLIEKGEKVREIEVGILDGDPPLASTVGEIIPHQEFYSYEAKYIDENGADLVVPAKLERKQIEDVQKLAIRTFLVLEASGLARVDFFLTEDQRFWINEINTMPGFTKISMYPTLWQASGVSYSNLIERLISLGIKKYQRDESLQTSY